VVGLHLQDPTKAGRTLLDALVDAGDRAERGGGIFAFASARGVAMLLDDPVLGKLTRTGEFELVVGTDAITDERALAALQDRMTTSHPGLRARVLVHDLSILFHPKLCWFARGEQLTLLVGSGNLTPGGLATNLEAFTVAELDVPEAAEAEAQIAEWLQRWNTKLLPPNAPQSLARAQQNSGAERSLRTPMPSEDEESEPPHVDDAGDVLVAEIPRNASGRTQVDIGQAHFTDFFGGEPRREKRILVQHVGAGGIVDDLEPPRALFRTQSDNYRFEAGAGRGREYPRQGRPIGVFVHSPDGIFRYRLLWPGEPAHAEVEAFLTAEKGPAGAAMRRVPTKLAHLRSAWPDSSL
jgi:hypothetical protein